MDIYWQNYFFSFYSLYKYVAFHQLLLSLSWWITSSVVEYATGRIVAWRDKGKNDLLSES